MVVRQKPTGLSAPEAGPEGGADALGEPGRKVVDGLSVGRLLPGAHQRVRVHEEPVGVEVVRRHGRLHDRVAGRAEHAEQLVVRRQALDR